MDIKLKGGYSRMTGWTTLNHPEYDRGFRNGQQSKQAEIRKAVLSLRNEFNLWADDTEQFHAIEAQIEQLEEILK